MANMDRLGGLVFVVFLSSSSPGRHSAEPSAFSISCVSW
jgi:hypothetical protein